MDLVGDIVFAFFDRLSVEPYNNSSITAPQVSSHGMKFYYMPHETGPDADKKSGKTVCRKIAARVGGGVFFFIIAFILLLLVTRIFGILTYDFAPVTFLPQESMRALYHRYADLFFPEFGLPSDLPLRIEHPQVVAHRPAGEKINAYAEKPKRKYVVQPIMVYTPYVTYAPAPGPVQYDDGNAGASVYHNRQQFRYSQDISRKAYDDEIRIFITGGSTAWGLLAPDIDSTIAGFLESILNERDYGDFSFRVVNAAAGGWSTTNERIWIVNRITEYDPDIIISYSGANDIAQVCERGLDLFWFAGEDQDCSYFWHAIREYERYVRGEKLVSLMEERDYDRECDFPRKTLKNVKVVANYLKSQDCAYVFVFQPLNTQHEDYQPSYGRMPYILTDEMAALAEELSFTFLSHHYLFEGREELFLDDCHFGDVGNEIIASTLADQLDEVIEELIENKRR